MCVVDRRGSAGDPCFATCSDLRAETSCPASAEMAFAIAAFACKAMRKCRHAATSSRSAVLSRSCGSKEARI
jgi:hypothetical protein